jgi:hypothetical protein
MIKIGCSLSLPLSQSPAYPAGMVSFINLLPSCLHWLVELVYSCICSGDDLLYRFSASLAPLLHISCGGLSLD